MSKGTSLPPAQRFSDRVDNYVRYRPRYPEQVIEWLRLKTGLGPEAMVVDIGSGTGISAEPFLRFGCHVFCAEPNQAMRNAAERLLSDHPTFHSVDGTAEPTTLGGHSVDLIVAAQAFPWFDAPRARAEFNRILKPSGWTALMWNVRRVDSTPFLRGYEQLLLIFATDYVQVRHENMGDLELKKFFTNSAYTTHSEMRRATLLRLQFPNKTCACMFAQEPFAESVHIAFPRQRIFVPLVRISKRDEQRKNLCIERRDEGQHARTRFA